MHRLIVAFLAAFDAVIAAAVGVAVVLAPLTLLWIFGFGAPPAWDALWPAAVSVWQLGNLVPLHIRLPAEYLAVTGIAESEASFLLSLAPLAFAAFTAIFAARSGARASRADAWMTGVVVGTLVFGALTAGAALTARNGIAAVHLWQAVLYPVLVFAVPAVVGAVVTEWREGGSGLVARVRDRIEQSPRGWGDAPGLIARGSGVVIAGLVGAGALVVAVAIVLGGGEVVALFQAGGVDLVGAVVLGVGQLTYLPTLVVWGIAFVAGPGFAVGVGTTVSPAGTQLGIVPGIPVLGILPESVSPWLLLLALLPVALGAFAGWIARSRLVTDAAPAVALSGTPDPLDPARTSVLEGLLADADVREVVEVAPPEHEPIAARLAIAAGIAIVSAGVVALFAWLASGSLGPGRLADVGPEPGPVALVVGLEVLVGAAILLLSPRRGERTAAAADGWTDVDDEAAAREAAVPVVAEDEAPDLAGWSAPRYEAELPAESGARPSLGLLTMTDAAPEADPAEPAPRRGRKKRKKGESALPSSEGAEPAAVDPPSTDSAGVEPDAVTAPIDLQEPPAPRG